jgi:hypothetical protein
MTPDAFLRHDDPPTPIHAAVAAMTAWIADEPGLGTAIAAGAIDRDPNGFLDAVAGLLLVVADVAAELGLKAMIFTAGRSPRAARGRTVCLRHGSRPGTTCPPRTSRPRGLD